MLRRLAALALATFLIASLVPATAGQSALPVRLAEDHEVLALDVPVLADGSGQLRIPVAGGVLDLRLAPLPVAGAGGQVDAQAYLVEALLLLPDGASLPLPTMVIVPEAQALQGPAAHELGLLSEQLRALEDLLADAEPPADQLEQVQQEVDALVAEAAWAVALAEQAAGVAEEGLGQQLVIADALLDRVVAALGFILDDLQRIQDELTGLLPPAPSSSASPTPSPSPSPSPTGPPPEPPLADQMEMLMDALADAEAGADEALAQAGEARDALDAIAEAALGEVADRGGAAMEGALVAVMAARAAAEQNLTRFLDAMRDEAQQRGNATAAFAGDAANATRAELEARLAELQWAADWVDEAQAEAPVLAQDALAAAEASIAAANRTVAAMHKILTDNAPPEAGGAADAALAQLEALQALLPPELQDAASALGDALAEAETFADGLSAMPEAQVDDADGLAVCLAAALSRACLGYAASVEPVGAVRVLVAVPMLPVIDVQVPGVIDAVNSLTGSATGLPIPVPSPTLPPLPTGLPGSGSASASPSASPSASASGSPSGPASTSTSGSPSSSGAAHLVATADHDALDLRMGEQGSLKLTVRNDGGAADRVRVTAQGDAPASYDTPTEVLELAPGEQKTVSIRVTPTKAGAGTVDLIATGESAGSVRDTVSISVGAAQAVAALIKASLEPTALQGAVGQPVSLTVRLANNGVSADEVRIAIVGDGVTADPASATIRLQPGATALQQVRLEAQRAGTHSIAIAITSERGVDLRPLVVLDASGALAGASDDGGSGSGSASQAPSAKDTPAVGVVAIVASLALLGLALRRRLEP